MTAITITDLNNAKLDVDHIAAVANSTELTSTDRLGQTKKTLAGKDADINVGAASILALSTAQADAALATRTAIDHRYRGALSADPATRTDGTANVVGDEVFSSTAGLLKRWNGAVWLASDLNTANLAASGGAGLIGYIRSATGTIATTPSKWMDLQPVNVQEFMTAAEIADALLATPLLNHTAFLQNAINAAAGRVFNGVKGHTYLIRDQLVIPSDIEINWNGATLLDDVRTFRPADQASRAKPLFYMYGVSNIKIRNFIYRAAATRATVSIGVPTGIIWIGDNSTTGAGPTHDIEISNIQASTFADYSLFVGIVGEAYNLHVHDINLTGNCSYGINTEYGQAPTGTTDALAYGNHPYNILVERFNGYDNSTSVGFLRVASSYNVKFSNCYGKDVSSFIYAWTGDRSISRVSQNVIFENCSHYASLTFLPGVVNYAVAVSCVNKDGSTGVALPSWTNYDHLFTFNNCQFQNNKTTDSAAVRFYGSQGSTVFTSCFFEDSYYGVRAEPGSNPDYVSEYSLTFNGCVFKNNTRDVLGLNITGAMWNHCKFKNADGSLIPIKLTGGSVSNKFRDCKFSGLAANTNYIVVDAGSSFNEFSDNLFDNVGGAAPMDLNAGTYGARNIANTLLTTQGWGKYGLIGEAPTMHDSLEVVPSTELDAFKRRQYVAQTGSVNKTINSIINGKVGDEIVVQSFSASATVTFNSLFSGVSTLERIVTPTNTQLVKTGSFWTVRLQLTDIGWILSE